MTTTLCGIRHHGPGSARAVLGVLEELQPDCVLIEGPPEGDPLTGELAREDVTAPVALMLHGSTGGSFYPLAEYSPEMVALRWAAHNKVSVRFLDAPYAKTSQMEEATRSGDPLGDLGRHLGYDDPEIWWEDTFETRDHAPREVFSALEDIMMVLRAQDEESHEPSSVDLLREASMRKILSEEEKLHANIVVVVGAWHLPALTFRQVTRDNQLIRELSPPKSALQVNMIPWSDRRLSQESGYRAGVRSPGWYAHLWRNEEHLTERWITQSAQLLRREGYATSTASVIETVHLAQALATLRERSTPNLDDLWEASRAVLTEGRLGPLQVIRHELIVGSGVGTLPEDVPQTPLQADLARTQKRLRMQPHPSREVELDLREETGRARSELLHQLSLLEVPWGNPTHQRSTGTFKESWHLHWDPQYHLDLAVQSHLGNTVPEAAQRRLQERLEGADLSRAVWGVEQALVANLPEGLRYALSVLDSAAASSTDLAETASTLEPLGATLRYGQARHVPVERLREVFEALVVRTVLMVPVGVQNLAEEESRAVLAALEGAHRALSSEGNTHHQDLWQKTLRDALDKASPLLSGWITRKLLDAQNLSSQDVQLLVDRHLRNTPPPEGVLWLQGLLQGSGALLVHNDQLWGVLDEWLMGLTPFDFEENLPLLRRTFAEYTPQERRSMGRKLQSDPEAPLLGFHPERSLLALPATLTLLEMDHV